MLKRLANSLVVASSLFLTACSGPMSTLDPAGPSARMVSGLWWGMFVVGTLVLVGVVWLWWHAMQRDGQSTADEQLQEKQNRWVIWGGIALPTAAITVLLAFGIPAGHRMLPWPADNVMEIHVEARQWYWQVHYPEHDIELLNEIYIPVNTPIDFHLTSHDVIHSFWVPRLGGKLDMIPGRTNVLRLEADAPGTYQGQCAEFCGRAHAFMKFEVIALSAEDFAAWQQEHAEEPKDER